MKVQAIYTRRRLIQYLLIYILCFPMEGMAIHRLWTVADGLPTGEVQQIIALPNHQMLINCEGVFCLSNGRSFTAVPCDHSRAYPMLRFAKRYHHLWQGDSLLWLRDLYKVYLFDVRNRAFRYDISPRIKQSRLLQKFANCEINPDNIPTRIWEMRDSLGLEYNLNCVALDHQGGIWMGTTQDGIIYMAPRQTKVAVIAEDKSWNGKTALAWKLEAQGMTDSKGRTWDWYGHRDLICNDDFS